MYTYINPAVPKDLEATAAILNNDGIIAYPSDVNWAFGCDAASPKALDRIRALKPHHPKDQPFSLVCSDISMASAVATVDNTAYGYLKRALPGPYTVILERNRTLPKQIKDKRKVVGVRVPDSPLIHSIVHFFGRPIATTSIPSVAMSPGESHVCRFGFQVVEYFGHALDLVIDLGDEVLGEETTIIDLSDGAPRLIRQGVGSPVVFGIDGGGQR